MGAERILVLGAGVIGSVYAGALSRAGHQVDVLARQRRLCELQAYGLELEDAVDGATSVMDVGAVERPTGRYDLVLVAVRAGQFLSTLPVLATTDAPDVLLFGNTAGRTHDLADVVGRRAVFGFPAVGGVRVDHVVRYAQIAQQRTTLGEPDGRTSDRLHRLGALFEGAGFPTEVTADVAAWLLGHAAFIAPIGLALRACGNDPARLAGDRGAMCRLVRGTRQAFRSLGSAGLIEIPTNLALLYRLPTPVVTAYWRRVFAGPRGELWFAAHCRAAPEETDTLAAELARAVAGRGTRTPDLDALLAAG